MTLADRINKMIEVALENAEFTSASPEFKNKLSSLGALDNPDQTEILCKVPRILAVVNTCA